MTLRARLYDARDEDRDIDLTHDTVGDVGERRLLWVDLDDRNEIDLERLASALELDKRIIGQLSTDRGRSRLLRFPDRIVVTLGLLEKEEDGEALVRRELDVLVGRNLVVTVHDGPLSAIEGFENELKDENGLGELDAGAFMTGLVDAVLASYFREIDAIDRQIEALDQLALRSVQGGEFLSTVVALRRRIAVIRRALTPNREALAPLVRPDFEVHGDVVRAWPGTIDRLERAIDAIEKSRELLVGSFDIYLGRSAQRSNDVMKILTILSAIALPGIVLAGVMGMNFKVGFFDDPNNFWVVIGAMVVFATALIVVARWRRWI
jgi:magnesium transporter